jgi:hypothetical protein
LTAARRIGNAGAMIALINMFPVPVRKPSS